MKLEQFFEKNLRSITQKDESNNFIMLLNSNGIMQVALSIHFNNQNILLNLLYERKFQQV